MNTYGILLLAPVLGLVVAFGLAQLVTLIRNDGYGRPGPAHQPPRSHAPDAFEPLVHL